MRRIDANTRPYSASLAPVVGSYFVQLSLTTPTNQRREPQGTQRTAAGATAASGAV